MPSGSAIAADGDGGGGGDDFYERIEAPKFFDFTVPDFCDTDDRYWFCRRVGCDQKHEEEIDPEKVFQTFVQQVMAARSPNVRLQKAQNRKCPSSSIKDVTLSAPAKPSKPRLLGPTVVPSLSSRKINEAELKVRPPLPNPKPKQSVAASKYLTTPRNKKGFPNPDSFHCVQDAKIPPSIEVPKNTVAKAPRKLVRMSISQELKTPLSRLWKGIKRRESASQQKGVLQQSILKKTRDIIRDYDKPWRLNTASKLRCGKSKKQAKDEKAKSSLDNNVENRGVDLPDSCGPLSYDEVDGNDLSDMDIDEKSRNGSLGAKSLTDGYMGFCGSKKHSQETTAAASGADMNSQSSSQESDPDDGGASNRQDSKEENCRGNKEHCVEARGKKWAGEEVPEELLPECHPTKDAFHGRETAESDEKQNESAASDDYKENSSAPYGGLTFTCDHLARKVVGSHETHSKTIQKSTPSLNKTCRDRTTSAITSTQGLKYKRSKPTNPILFGLQTDVSEERGVLREANLDRGLQNVEPKKETPTVSKIISTNSQKRQRNELSHQNRTAETDPSKAPMEQETGTGASQRRAIKTPGMPKLVKDNNDEFEKSEHSKKTEPLSSRQGASSTRKRTIAVMKPRRLSLDKESSALELRSKIKGNASKQGGATATMIAKASTSVLGSSTRERSIATASVKLNSNSVLHVPKSCAKKRP